MTVSAGQNCMFVGGGINGNVTVNGLGIAALYVAVGFVYLGLDRRLTSRTTGRAAAAPA